MSGERHNIDLDGNWHFCPDPSDEGVSRGYHQPTYSHNDWPTCPVPSVFEVAVPELHNYFGTCWYRRRFSEHIPRQKNRVYLLFDAVNYRCTVFVNGVSVHENRDGFLPFEVDITDQIRDGDINLIAVAVDNRHYAGDVPGSHVGWYPSGGIISSVHIEHRHQVHAKDVYVDADHLGHFAVHAILPEPVGTELPADLQITFTDSEGHTVYTATTTHRPGTKQVAKGTLTGHKTWSPDTPCLYDATVTCSVGGRVTDIVSTRFGFRTISVSPTGLTFNGSTLYMKGFNRHADSPTHGFAYDEKVTRDDLLAMKEAGANCVRLCHYPHSPAELDLCDAIGLIAFCEIPLYFWNDERDGRDNQRERAGAAKHQLTAMIHRDRSHPSIGFWSVSNETNEFIDSVAADNRDLIRHARSLDPTRLCVHVSNHWQDYPNFDEDDLICINGYPSMAWDDLSSESWPETEHANRWWQRNIAVLHEKYPDKPILVTEFGYVSIAGTRGNRFGEDTHGSVLAREYEGMHDPWVCGALIWCWADHPWPAGRFLGGLTTSPFGVVSRARKKKLAYGTAGKLFSGSG